MCVILLPPAGCSWSLQLWPLHLTNPPPSLALPHLSTVPQRPPETAHLLRCLHFFLKKDFRDTKPKNAAIIVEPSKRGRHSVWARRQQEVLY